LAVSCWGSGPEESEHWTAVVLRQPLVQAWNTHRVANDWRTNGVRVVRSDELDPNTPQTPGMTRAAAITAARGGAEKLWAGTVIIEPAAKTGAHHHGPVESVIYVVSGRARMRWGERMEYVAEAGPGDFIYVPPYVPHQEINAEPSEPLSCGPRALRSRAGGRESRPRRRRAQPAAGALGRRHPPGAVMLPVSALRL
jgi:uncharacterized RmlC-like cupin family protein